jgi:hypothetical protein
VAAEKLDEGTTALSPAERVIHRRASVDICLTGARILSPKFQNRVKMRASRPLFLNSQSSGSTTIK